MSDMLRSSAREEKSVNGKWCINNMYQPDFLDRNCPLHNYLSGWFGCVCSGPIQKQPQQGYVLPSLHVLYIQHASIVHVWYHICIQTYILCLSLTLPSKYKNIPESLANWIMLVVEWSFIGTFPTGSLFIGRSKNKLHHHIRKKSDPGRFYKNNFTDLTRHWNGHQNNYHYEIRTPLSVGNPGKDAKKYPVS